MFPATSASRRAGSGWPCRSGPGAAARPGRARDLLLPDRRQPVSDRVRVQRQRAVRDDRGPGQLVDPQNSDWNAWLIRKAAALRHPAASRQPVRRRSGPTRSSPLIPAPPPHPPSLPWPRRSTDCCAPSRAGRPRRRAGRAKRPDMPAHGRVARCPGQPCAVEPSPPARCAAAETAARRHRCARRHAGDGGGAGTPRRSLQARWSGSVARARARRTWRPGSVKHGGITLLQ